ncbi:efflux RND transporter periplasmic adaptor subunit [Pseudomonas cichorii]|uniref:Efflux RND transporter periplasmic adaptor subunit n=1 Tax=Pseudomonas lijiangensis TaxID=2995658 RepID=A0ABX8HZH5_9PSED|nr:MULTISPECIES: efflux RND transporter periplasmic adaptor subunit [Pseudomonas syringae group]MBX8492773.1 efflux RND transporter periplasmic adaptor subunit [Pseudomonas cichorii]MBX8501568.1 efflux RND transporter periplasmic adaptor subunit [Pseudomonas lijiangensis]MBX8506470.1 efflux RND transporter periplasmic adaptor subunit [Pseudomonas lijiangensis]MBX8509905.1 efflux RND transporter periplasmic adaptor subunit [Pseudomonas cichorii]MBX8518585.1 efflux RND transporter periplasmic ad
MNNKRNIAAATAVVVLIGLGSLTLGGGPFFSNASSEHAHDDEKESSHGQEKGHEGEGHDDHGDEPKGKPAEKDEHGDEGHGEEGHEEEGALELSEAQIKAAGIELGVAASRQMSTSVSFPGEIRFDEDRTSHVVPRVSGVVEEVKADLGQQVRKGQVLAVIASQQVSEQRSELSAAQRRVELARLTFQREKKLWEDKISAEQDYQQARQALQEAEIALSNARQKVSAMGAAGKATGNRYELVAPFDSVVVEKHLGLGEVVSESSNVFTLSDLSRVWATFGVTPKDLDKVIVGRNVKVSSPDMNAEVEGQVSYVGNLLGEQSRAATVRVKLANPQGAWRPGLFVSVAVAAHASEVAVSIPEEAIQTVEDKPSVFVRTPQGFQAQPVTLGRSDSGYVEVLKGLAVNTQVATAGSFVLKSELGKGSAEHAH